MMKLTSYWRVAEYATLKYATLVYWFLSCRHLKNNQSIERLPPNSFHLSKDILQKELNWGVPSSLPQEFHQPEKTDSQERRLEVDTTSRQTLSQTIISSIHSSKSPFIFLKNHFSPLRDLQSLSPFLIKIDT